MPLIPCPDCATEVSDAAPHCPKCNRPMPAQTQGAMSLSRKFMIAAMLMVPLWLAMFIGIGLLNDTSVVDLPMDLTIIPKLLIPVFAFLSFVFYMFKR